VQARQAQVPPLQEPLVPQVREPLQEPLVPQVREPLPLVEWPQWPRC
jgi:hypothetical protein